MRLLLWALIGAMIVIWLSYLKKKWLKNGQLGQRPVSPVSTEAPESMCQCMHCKVHIPLSEALYDISGSAFCCETHRRQHAHS
jgi:uncharacterized protein